VAESGPAGGLPAAGHRDRVASNAAVEQMPLSTKAWLRPWDCIDYRVQPGAHVRGTRQ
jgi:hypothetical protein